MRFFSWGVILVTLLTVLGVTGAAQGCDECREIKKELRDAALVTSVAATPSAAEPTVRVVLYWAEGCGHCDEVLDGVLPLLEQQYAAQLEVRLIEVVSMEDIAAFFDVAEGYGYARGHAEVPFLLIGERALMGAEQISIEMPKQIDLLLQAGGAEWPDERGRPATQQWLPPADVGCAFATPCAEETPAVPAPEAAGGDGSGSALPTVATLGLVSIAGGGLAAVLRRRTARRHIRSSTSADTKTLNSGDSDAT